MASMAVIDRSEIATMHVHHPFEEERFMKRRKHTQHHRGRSDDKEDGEILDDFESAESFARSEHLDPMNCDAGELANMDCETSISSRNCMSRSPVYEQEVGFTKHGKVNNYTDELDFVGQVSRKRVRAGDSYVAGNHSPSHVGKRSRERRSRSPSYIHHNADRVKSSEALEESSIERDSKRVGRHDREDSRDRYRGSDRERERRSSSSTHGESERSSSSSRRHSRREDRHGSRGSLMGEEREKSSSSGGRQRNENRHVSVDLLENDGKRERGSERRIEKNISKDTNKRRERKDLDREAHKGFSHSEHTEPGFGPDKRTVHQSKESGCTLGDSEMREDKPKSDEDVQENCVFMVEEDIDEIREKSRKIIEAAKERERNQKKQFEGHFVDSEMKDKPVEHILWEKLLLNCAPKGDISVQNNSSVVSLTLKNGPVTLKESLCAGPLGEGAVERERSPDMFSDDIFGQSPVGACEARKGLQIERNVLSDNCDDAEGYYSVRFGELLQNRYEVIATHGKGVFSNVVRVKDHKAEMGEPGEVAIKIIRNNHIMNKAGEDERKILKRLADADPTDRCHCVRFISSFKHRNHLCLVFESLCMDLRAVVKKFGRDIGLNLDAVSRYAKQLFIALQHLEDCGVLHSDIKPDNILVNEAKNRLKLSDFGSAMLAGENEITPYLVSRFYRAPEVILGLRYHHPMDMWSVGCCLYELYSGKILFPGSSNSEMLRLHMELKGPFPKKMLKKGLYTNNHFDHDLNFKVEGSVTKQTEPRTMNMLIAGSRGEDPKRLACFKDLLEKMFILDPERRIKVSEALNHPFVTGKARSKDSMSTAHMDTSNCKNISAE